MTKEQMKNYMLSKLAECQEDYEKLCKKHDETDDFGKRVRYGIMSSSSLDTWLLVDKMCKEMGVVKE